LLAPSDGTRNVPAVARRASTYARKPRGLSNAQARELGRLCRLLGRPYPGNGMAMLEASRTIDELRAEVERQRRPRPPR